jgi:hypothetical protein
VLAGRQQCVAVATALHVVEDEGDWLAKAQSVNRVVVWSGTMNLDKIPPVAPARQSISISSARRSLAVREASYPP